MPCNCDHMEASRVEIEVSRIACLLDELNGQTEINRHHWDGYHPNIYNKHRSHNYCDVLIQTLCSRLQQEDVTKYSLEMQLWWRDHQETDRKKMEDES